MDAAEWAWCQARAADMRRSGYENEVLLDTQAVRGLLPGLSDRALGGLVSHGDGHANPAATARAFRDAAAAAGAQIAEHCAVQGLDRMADGRWRVETGQGRFSAAQVVNCAGAWGAEVAALVDEFLPPKSYPDQWDVAGLRGSVAKARSIRTFSVSRRRPSASAEA